MASAGVWCCSTSGPTAESTACTSSRSWRRWKRNTPQILTIIGVHSAKYSNEREVASLRHAIRRHQITHPGINDADLVIWQRHGVRAWPTLVLIDPSGYVVGAVAGEGHGPVLNDAIADLIAQHRTAGSLRGGPGPGLTAETAEAAPRAFPGKVAVDSASDRLALADSGQCVETLFGGGRPGTARGDRPQFFEPGGLAAAPGRLYVADTNHHRICVADLATGIVVPLRLHGPVAAERLENPFDAPANPCYRKTLARGPPAALRVFRREGAPVPTDSRKLGMVGIGAGGIAALSLSSPLFPARLPF